MQGTGKDRCCKGQDGLGKGFSGRRSILRRKPRGRSGGATEPPLIRSYCSGRLVDPGTREGGGGEGALHEASNH